MKRIRSFAFVAVPEEKPNPRKDRKVVEILVVEEGDKVYYLNQYTKEGEFVSDSSHKTIEEAEEQGEHDYPQLFLSWTEVEGVKSAIEEVIETFNFFKEMDISECKDSTVIKIGTHEVTGFVDFQRCGTCHCLRIYNDKFDRYFCPRCNKWLESGCDDPKCKFCTTITDKPLSL